MNRSQAKKFLNLPNSIIDVKPLTPSNMKSDYHLTQEQIDSFNENGYLVLRKWVTGSLLEYLQEAADKWIEEADEKIKSGDYGHYGYATKENKNIITRINFINGKGNNESLEFLGSPYVAAVAESICGKNFVPAYEALVVKQKTDGLCIPWHQDTVHKAEYPVLVYGLYLDESKKESGALKIIPKTHKKENDICEFVKYGWDPPGVVQVEMEPGDLLLHEVMVVHGSQKMFNDSRRRTLYFEFRSAEHVINEGPWQKEWVDTRIKFLPLAFNKYRSSFPGNEQFNWRPDEQYIPLVNCENLKEEIKSVEDYFFANTPGKYCLDNSKLMT